MRRVVVLSVGLGLLVVVAPLHGCVGKTKGRRIRSMTYSDQMLQRERTKGRIQWGR